MDYSNFTDAKAKKKTEQPPASPNASGANLRWWELEGNEQASSITSTLLVMDRMQLNRVAQLITNARLYGGTPMTGAGGFSYSRFVAASSVMRDRLTYNLIQSAGDTAIAKLSKNKPKPLSLTSGGDFKIQRKAKKLNQFIDGIFYEQKAYEKRGLALRDSFVNGDGMIYVHSRHKRVAFDRVLISEIWVDEMEGFYGEPRSMHRVSNVDRHKLISEFPEAKDLIEKAMKAPMEDARTPNISDAIRVRESWHLPSGPEAKDGRFVISIAEGVLEDAEWKHEFFPFARWSWSPRMYGYWSQGGAEQLSPTQIELNELLRVIQRAHKLSGSFVIFLENGSKVVKAHLDNEIGRIVNYSGTKPQYETPPICPPELYAQVETLIRRGYELVGISELNAQGVKPAGLNSGRALREMDDIGSDRFTTIAQNDERAMVELGRLAIVTAREISEEEGGYEVKVPGSRFLRTIDWKEIDLDDDAYVMQCFPVSSLPSDPAGRLETIQEYAQAGFISPDVAQKLLEFPDLQQYESLQNAMEDRLQEIFDAIVDDGEFNPPEPYYNLQRAKELCIQYIVRGESQHLDGDRLEMLHTFNDQLDALAAAAQAAALQAQQAQAAASAPPQAKPLPPPQSDLLPNGAGAQA